MELTKNQKIMIGVAVVAVAFFMYQRRSSNQKTAVYVPEMSEDDDVDLTTPEESD